MVEIPQVEKEMTQCGTRMDRKLKVRKSCPATNAAMLAAAYDRDLSDASKTHKYPK
jgi:hypothetical protein